MLVCYVYVGECLLSSQSRDYGGIVQLFFQAFLYFVWYVYCLLDKEPGSLYQIRLLCFQLSRSCSANSSWRIDIFHQTCSQQSRKSLQQWPPPPPLIKNIMGILKDIRHIHLESPSWSNRALNPKHSRNTCLLCLWRRKSPFFTVNGVWRDGTTFLSSLPLLHLICLLPFGQGNR